MKYKMTIIWSASSDAFEAHDQEDAEYKADKILMDIAQESDFIVEPISDEEYEEFTNGV